MEHRLLSEDAMREKLFGRWELRRRCGCLRRGCIALRRFIGLFSAKYMCEVCDSINIHDESMRILGYVGMGCIVLGAILSATR